METINPSTRPMMMLLLWVLYFGHTAFGSPLDSHEMELLEMIFRDAEGYPSSDRGPRDIDVLPATSIGCDESGSEEYNMFEDLEHSEECLDFLPPCEEPAYDDRLPMEHPCFVRMLLLRTPLLKQDPCANFSLATQPPKVNKKPKHKKCNPKAKKNKIATKTELVPPSNNGTVNSTAAPIATSTEPNSKIIRISKLIPRKRKNITTTSTSTTSTTTTLETTTVEETTRPVELTTTTTETEPPTTTELETTTLPPTTTEPPLAENQLKRFRSQTNRKKNVPDPPQIKLDGNSQPSEVIQVIMTTEAAEMRQLPDGENSTTVTPTTAVVVTTSAPETTTEESCEAESVGDSGDGESSKQRPEFSEAEEQDVEGNRIGGDRGGEEPCEDTEEQDTNLCPQVVPAQRNTNSRHPPSPRFRKPIKNYVEPILYEGHFDKPHHQMPVGPQQRDYFISNKQIMPRPKPKYKKRIPPSIYVNNIVRGMDCNDENDSQSEEHSRNHPNQPQRHWDLRRIGFASRNQVLRKPVTERNVRNFVPIPPRRLISYPEHSVRSQERSQYLMEREPEPRPIHPHYPEEDVESPEERPMPSATPTSPLDPCQEDHDFLHQSPRQGH
ncbi:hypothetical protein KR067_013178, partial [Drosophila pandora]